MAEWQLDLAVAAGMEALGWRADVPEVRDVVPPVLRGTNVVAILPPGPAWATPILAALLGRTNAPQGSVLVLAAPSLLAEWVLAAGALLEGTALQVAVAGASGIGANLVIASPESALDAHSRSALQPDRFRAVVFAWPEQWQAGDAVTALLQDFPKDAQRIVLTAQRDRLDGTDGVVERYARKAVVVGGAAVTDPATPARTFSVRTVPAPWGTRAGAVAAVLATSELALATIWTADARDHQLIRRTLGSLPSGVQLATRVEPKQGTIICYDLPTAAVLTSLTAIGEVILVVPPGTEQYVAAIAPNRRPMQPRSAALEIAGRDAALRGEIVRAIDAGTGAAGLYALAPLFEVHDPQLVAAALFSLWRTAVSDRPATPASTPAAAQAPSGERSAGLPSSGNAAVAKLWIGAGKKDDATVADFVAVLVREVGVERSRIGRIELRDTFALVEVPAADAEAIALRLSGITIRKRKLTARVDQGRGGGVPKRRT